VTTARKKQQDNKKLSMKKQQVNFVRDTPLVRLAHSVTSSRSNPIRDSCDGVVRRLKPLERKAAVEASAYIQLQQIDGQAQALCLRQKISENNVRFRDT